MAAADAPPGVALVPLAVGRESRAVVAPNAAAAWLCTRAEIAGDDALTLTFHLDAGAQATVVIQPRDAPGPVLRRLSRCSVRYTARVANRSAELREAVGQLVHRTAEAIDARLAEAPSLTLVEALGRLPSGTRVPFSADGLRRLLGGSRAAEVLPGGYRIHDVFSRPDGGDGPNDAYVIDLRREGDERSVHLEVSLRQGDDDTAHLVTPHLALRDLTPRHRQTPHGISARVLVGLMLELMDHEGVVFQRIASRELGLPPAATAAAAPAQFHLVLNSECHQRCAFCSLRDVVPVEAAPTLALDALHSAAERGTRSLLLTGFDPLTHPRLLEVLDEARNLHFSEVQVLSPSTRFAEPAFADAVLARLPAQRRMYVPIYGMNPEVHDRVVGRAGAHALVLRAIEVLLERTAPADVVLSTVFTEGALGELSPLAKFAAKRKLRLIASMPYPNHPLTSKDYAACIPRQTDVAVAWLDALKLGPRIDLVGLAPCVSFRVALRSRVPVRKWLHLSDEPPQLPGTNEPTNAVGEESARDAKRTTSLRIPCPHAARCALRPSCPGELDQQYVARYGLDEIQPVTLNQLFAAI